MLKKFNFVPFLLSPLHTTLEAVRMQHPPPIDAGTLAIEGLESTGHANMALLLLNMPPPEKAAEPPDWPSPEQNRSPVDVEGLLEPSQGEGSWHAMWHKSPLLARTLRGTAPLGKMYGHPPDLFDLRSQGSIVLEQDVVIPKAQKPIFVKGECVEHNVFMCMCPCLATHT